ncbi:MAG: formate transporter FocA [Chloroflexota bacterium]
MITGFTVDALLPPDMAARAEDLGLRKARLGVRRMFALAVLAGAFIALGAVFATTVTAGNIAIRPPDGSLAYSTGLPFGVNRLLGGVVFSLGLIPVIVGGAELFTGNNLIVMAFASGKVTLHQLLRNWLVVYLGNFVGSIATAIVVFLSGQHVFPSGTGAIGLNMLNIGEAKTSLGFIEAVALGLLCNTLVCLAVWLCFSARSTTEKILSIIPPISAFVAAGFEHSAANMYFIPVALFVKQWGNAAFFEAIHATASDFPHLTWGNFLLANLLPVTLGNIIGGALMVGLVYWFVYLRKPVSPP